MQEIKHVGPLRYKQADLDPLGIVYIGQQDRVGKFSLDMFTDLHTGSSFKRMPEESLVEARDRIRRGFERG